MMKNSLYIFCLILGIFTANVTAKIQSATIFFESKMSVNECKEIAKEARESIFDEKFGELISDNSYDYISKNVHIGVSCIVEKDLIIVFVATQDVEALYYVDIFTVRFKDSGKVNVIDID